MQMENQSCCSNIGLETSIRSGNWSRSIQEGAEEFQAANGVDVAAYGKTEYIVVMMMGMALETLAGNLQVLQIVNNLLWYCCLTWSWRL